MQSINNFEQLLGETLVSFDISDGKEEIVIKTESGKQFMMFHYQDCCEHVYLQDVSGDISDLIGSPILIASENISSKDPDEDPNKESTSEDYYDSNTWTFYKLATIKGYVDLRWHGSSNGYYSEIVDFDRIEDWK